jgi:ribosome-binding factor A
MSSRRPQQVASTLQKKLGELLVKLDLPHLTTITRVEVSPDLKYSKIWITVFSEKPSGEKAVLLVLQENLYDLQGEINRYFKSKNIPRIAFAIDHSLKHVSNIEKLLKETKE